MSLGLWLPEGTLHCCRLVYGSLNGTLGLLVPRLLYSGCKGLHGLDVRNFFECISAVSIKMENWMIGPVGLCVPGSLDRWVSGSLNHWISVSLGVGLFRSLDL